MTTIRTLIALVLFFGGMLTATVGADVFVPESMGLGVAIAGSLVAFASPIFFEEDLNYFGVSDERFTRIYQRAGYLGWYAMIAIGTTAMLAIDHLSTTVSAKYAVLGVVGVGLLAFIAGVSVLERRM